jgi:hypothetical protein
LIAEFRDRTIVLDDLSVIFHSRVALQVLLSALEVPAGKDRPIYRCRGDEVRVAFCGGIVCISNKELHNDEILGAFKSRVHTFKYDPSDAQVGALMLDIAGCRLPPSCPTVTKEEAVVVARYLIAEMIRLGCRFDLRLYIGKALPDYQRHKDGECESDWRDLVTAAVQEHLAAVEYEQEEPVSRANRLKAEQAIVEDILSRCPTRAEQIREWTRRMGKSMRAFYRRLGEVVRRPGRTGLRRRSRG